MPYVVRLSNFEGPMDLLLHLIHSAKVDIRDVFIANITDQFIVAIESAPDYMDSASEFVGMAALLLELKARSLLPKPPEEESDESPEEIFFRRLEEYKRIKEALDPLRVMEREAERRFSRLPGEVEEGEVMLSGVTLEALVAAFNGILSRAAPVEDVEVSGVIRRESFTVEQGMFHIISAAGTSGRVMFSALFTADMVRGDVIAMFLALLELIRSGRVTALQEEPMGDITIETGGVRHG